MAAPPAYKVPSRSSRYARGVSRLTIPARRPPYIPSMIPLTQLLTQAALLARLAAPSPYPFNVGETLRYEAKLGYFPVGTASVSVTRMVKERGAEAFEFTASGEGGPPGWRVAYDMTSHVGAAGVHSLRFHRRLVQGGKTEEHGDIIIPESGPHRGDGVSGGWGAPTEAP